MLTNIVLERPNDYRVIDHDGLWKKIIQELFEEFILFFIPDLAEELDFSKRPEFLEQELFKEIIQEKKGKQIADQIVKVYSKTGEEKWLIIHIEIEGSPRENFSKRMFRYFYHIYDKFNVDVVAMAVLTNNSNVLTKGEYHYALHGTSLTYQYNLFKISDYSEDELLNSDNPFAMAILAAKYVHETKDDVEKRYQFKIKLMKILSQKRKYPHEYNRMYISVLIYFIDYLLQIPLELTKKLREQLIEIKEGKEMVYINRDSMPISWGEFERIVKAEGREEGKAEGKLEGKKEGKRIVAKKLLEDGMSFEFVAKYTEIPMEELKKLVNIPN
ncbi:hypothetical protein [Aquibacillus salsiterrae]|uniref:Transposase (putative) YhgA-like domain-containing protein n=1 Tax=Aquibacillus salsiterrae TaxID=2950439 RepID=A0A9X3WDX0_9BACI|nr:hypothetical protein [Aquibacillus salsiterrae]MDC3416676.1 hypothetical protein [Aquibacillus salsiterrae]